MASHHSQLASPQVVSLSRCDRWCAHQRLQELSIPSQCLSNGQLAVEIHTPVALVQLRSVLQQLTASRPEQLKWLERCWEA